MLTQFNYGKISWNKYLLFEDFKGLPNVHSIHDASISSNFRWRVNKVLNYPPAIIIAIMDPVSSWVKNPNKYYGHLLEHEQNHFNITEINRRKATDSIANMWGSNSEKIESIINYFEKLNNVTQDKYDSLTNHGINLVAQEEWTESIKNQLCSCTHEVSRHHKEVMYYAMFATEMEGVSKIVKSFWLQIIQVSGNKSVPLDSLKTSDLDKEYKKAKISLNQSMVKLSSVEEIDLNVKLKEKTLSFLQNIKVLQDSAVPTCIKILRNGLGKRTDMDTETINKLKLKGEELQTEANYLENLYKEFQTKHIITNEELSKY